MDGIGSIELSYQLGWVQLFGDRVAHFLGQGQLLILLFREFRIDIVSNGEGLLEGPYSEIAALSILGMMLMFETALDVSAAIEKRVFLNNIILVNFWNHLVCLEPSLFHDIGIALTTSLRRV